MDLLDPCLDQDLLTIRVKHSRSRFVHKIRLLFFMQQCQQLKIQKPINDKYADPVFVICASPMNDAQ